MDMKKFLQAVDGASAKKPVEGSNDMKKFLQIVKEGKQSSTKLTQAETIAVNHYTKQQKPIQEENLKLSTSIDKYFKKVEEELLENDNKKKAKATQLAERVIAEVGGNYGHPSNFRKHISQSKLPPDNIRNMAKKGAKGHLKNEETEGVDSVTLDIPLLIRLMEFAREDAQDDMALHQIAERLVGMAEEGQSLSMSDYESIVGSESIDEACWKTHKQIGMKKKGGRTVPNCVPKESIAEESKRCPQCGSTNCTCPPGKCKCKPVKGWLSKKAGTE